MSTYAAIDLVKLGRAHEDGDTRTRARALADRIIRLRVPGG